MTTHEKPMTKTEAIASVRRAREGLRWIEEALRNGDASDLHDAILETIGAVAQIQDASDSDYGRGIAGVSEPGYVHTDAADGARVEIPTVEGPRNVPTLATVVGPDPDNAGHTLVRTDALIMGEHVHSIEDADLVPGWTPPGIPSVDAISLTTNGQAVRVTIEDSTEGIRALLGAREIDVIMGDEIRVYFDANGATDERPENVSGSALVEFLSGKSLTLDEPLRGPLLIAGRPSLSESVVDTIGDYFPSFDYAGRW